MKCASSCIYCRKDASGAQGLAHVIPEALVRNPVTLPKGYVCDGCNRYLGKLDSALVALPHISMPLQWHGIVGKQGRPRQKLGSVSSQHHGEIRKLGLKGELKEFSRNEDGKHVVRITIPTRASQEAMFRRSLHHIALNDYARLWGADAALDAPLDRVRDYVRRPRVGESWVIGFGETEDSSIPLKVELYPLLKMDAALYYIQLFHLRFLVDLLGRNLHPEAVRQGFQVLGEDSEFPPASLTYRES